MNESSDSPATSRWVFVREYAFLVACLVLFVIYAARQGPYTVSFLQAWWGN